MRAALLVLILPSVAAPLAAQSLASRAPAAAFADSDRVAKLSTAFPAIDSLMRAFAHEQHVPGAAWGIVIDGRLVHRGTAGVRNVATGAPVDSASVFRIASMTKSFTALAVLRLRDEGKLALDDPAERYLPELKALRYPTSDAPRITVRHLLTHSAGFPEDNPWGDQQLAATDRDLDAMLRRGIPFSTAPGTAYEYSNYGFALLGRLVERVSGRRYTDYIARELLAPLGMTVTTLEPARVAPARLALGYRWEDGAWREEPQLPHGAFGAMGGMLTSIDDLARWVGFMLDAWPPRDGADAGPVRRASRREMQQVARFAGAAVTRDAEGQPQLTASGYGYGLGARATCRFPLLVAHSGGLPGFGSVMRWLPDYGVGIVALGNRTYTGWTAPTNTAFELLARTGGLVPRVPRPAPVLETRAAQVTRLLTGWSDALADSLAAMNLYLDDAKPRRQRALAELVRSAGGSCRREGALVPENALRGSWRLRCATGDLRVTITLAPTEPAGVQFLEVAPLDRDAPLGPVAACR